ncbi:Lsm family RNA-binding protein [Candidatus Bathyarchaeota archaeon]|nr:Lsm family RNA-binding protein [Candidatus Bathyarchaeota archaeon]
MAAVTSRKFFEELGQLVSKPVVVVDVAGKIYEGELLGYDSSTLSICLGNVKGDKGTITHRLFIAGSSVARIIATERPFNLEGLKERLDRVFPNMVQIYAEAGVIVVMGKIRLNEQGIIEGTGPAADRVKDIYQRFLTETTHI